MYEPWAIEVITRIGSYIEVSPSGTGAKDLLPLPDRGSAEVAR